jgi:hypothetical protein
LFLSRFNANQIVFAHNRSMKTHKLIGGAWLAAHTGVELVMPLAVQSCIGGRRGTHVADGITTETYVESMRPSADVRGHLTFHLKHEVLHLELISRVFSQIQPQALASWISAEPSGQYARRAGFLFEWLTGQELTLDAIPAGSYVDVVDSQKLVAASEGRAVPNKRWRVRDNLPGTQAFCPLIRKTPDARLAMALDVPRLLHALASEFGEDVLMRSAVWMTLRESKSSFAIEGEADKLDRIQRFADVLARRTGQGAWPLNQAALAQLQSEILGSRVTLKQFGLRKSPVFVGQVARLQEVVHYVAPPFEDMAAMLDGLQVFLERTTGQSTVMRSAVAAFGFVYIHPLADGNGRVHRFLINDVLRRDGAVQAPMVLPVSSLISSDAAERRAYENILDSVSAPLMRAVTGQYAFASGQTVYADGIRSNFVFKGDELARPVWRHLDLTLHVVYLADVLERTIKEDMREESRYLRSHALARASVKDIVEMPDAQIDRLIRSAQANQGKLSNVLRDEIPLLADPKVWEAVMQGITDSFKD